MLTAVRWAVDASHVPPISISSGSCRPRHHLRLHEARATDELAGVEPALGERQHPRLGLVVDEPLDVVLHRVASPGTSV